MDYKEKGNDDDDDDQENTYFYVTAASWEPNNVLRLPWPSEPEKYMTTTW